LKLSFSWWTTRRSRQVLRWLSEAMRADGYAAANKPILTNLPDILQGIKAPGPKRIPNRILKHQPKRSTTLMKVVYALSCNQYFPPAWKHIRVVSTLKPGKDRTVPTFKWPVNLLHTVDKFLGRPYLLQSSVK
jgi:hypothetical protein